MFNLRVEIKINNCLYRLFEVDIHSMHEWWNMNDRIINKIANIPFIEITDFVKAQKQAIHESNNNSALRHLQTSKSK